MSNFSKERFLGGKLTPTSIFRRIGEVWESQNAVVPDRVLNRLDVPPFMSDLLLWTDGKTYDPTTHQIKSRITPEYNLTLKQGLVAKGDGATGSIELTNKGYFTETAYLKIELYLGNLGTAATERTLIYFSKTNYNKCRLFMGASNKLAFQLVGTRAGYIIFDYIPVGNEHIVFTFENGIAKVYSDGVLKNTKDYSATSTKLYANATSTSRIIDSNSCSIANLKIYDGASLDNLLSYHPFDGSAYDISGNNYHGTIVGGVDLTARSDYASFYCDEYGFAVKTGVIYPKLLSGTGYAGLVGEPDAVYQGLIAQTGKIEVKGQSYFDTLFSFTHVPNTEIENAGIIIHGAGAMDGENCNSNNILTAETSLNTSYPNALTASVLNTESIQVFNGTNNANQRVFVKVSNPVYKADNSSLLESGTITDILVYKRDLTPDEQVRVMLWCHNLDFLSVDLVKVGAEYLFVDDNIVYVCKV